MTQGVMAEKGHLPPPPEENYNSMILDYDVSGAWFEEPTYSDDWTRSYTYQGKLDPSFGGVLRVTGHAQWLTYPGPEAGYPWEVTVTVSAGSETRTETFSPKTKIQRFDVSVPIGNAQEGHFRIHMSRSSDAGSRNMKAEGHMKGRVTYGPGNPTSTSVTGAALDEKMAREIAEREMADPTMIGQNQVLYTGNSGGVANGGKPPHFTLSVPTQLHFIMSYHYNNGQGAPAGTIAIRAADGKVYGPWKATALNKVYWIVNPQIKLPPGSYEVIDSDPATWSQNGSSHGYGHVLIKGRH